MSATTDRERLGSSPAAFSASCSSPAARLAAAFGAVLDRVLDWQERAAQRRHLVGLDERMLRDIGLTRTDVIREYRKRPWQP